MGFRLVLDNGIGDNGDLFSKLKNRTYAIFSKKLYKVDLEK
jgi:hypothetical protein